MPGARGAVAVRQVTPVRSFYLHERRRHDEGDS
jgi:hypothetical protein